MQKVVVAMDSFKGCLSSKEAGEAVCKGIKSVYPACEVICLPVADGGEGLLDAVLTAMNGTYITLTAHDPLMQKIETRYVISGDRETAIIEMAMISGLPLVPPEKHNPMETTSFGTGELIRSALDKGCRHIILGIGGSATNDAGLGLLQALGFRFLDQSGIPLGTGGKILSQVQEIDFSSVHPALKETRFTIACDVNNPFYGPQGAAYIFAPQKGADTLMVKELDNGLRALEKVIRKTTGKDIANIPGAGAAGGIGGSLFAFLNAKLQPGIELLFDMIGFPEKVSGANLIITGEGKADRQTVMGKLPSGILAESKNQGIPVVLLAGTVEDYKELNDAGFQGIYSITPGPVSLEKAMESSFASYHLERVTKQLCRTISALSNQTNS